MVQGVITGTGTITGTTVNLTTSSGSIGTSSASPLQTAATNLTFNDIAGSVYINQTGNVNLGASTVGGNLNFTSTGNITINR